MLYYNLLCFCFFFFRPYSQSCPGGYVRSGSDSFGGCKLHLLQRPVEVPFPSPEHQTQKLHCRRRKVIQSAHDVPALRLQLRWDGGIASAIKLTYTHTELKDFSCYVIHAIVWLRVELFSRDGDAITTWLLIKYLGTLEYFNFTIPHNPGDGNKMVQNVN